MQKPKSTILDIGFGTAVLTSKLYEHGHKIDGIDFSLQMISIARGKMPTANLIEWDISKGLPEEVKGAKYDSIISTYTLHHLTDEQKISFIQQLLPLLNDEGKILIGDIAFETEAQLEACREENKAHWDDDEFYFVAEKIKTMLQEDCQCEYTQVSHCGGVFVITK